MQLITRLHQLEDKKTDSILDEYQDLFEGLGCIRDDYHLHVNPDITPHVDAPRTVPHAIQKQVKAELDRMEKLGVIVRQVDPTAWVNSMTVVRKSNKVRVCLDPTKLKKPLCEHTIHKTQLKLLLEACQDQDFSPHWMLILDIGKFS